MIMRELVIDSFSTDHTYLWFVVLMQGEVRALRGSRNLTDLREDESAVLEVYVIFVVPQEFGHLAVTSNRRQTR